MPIVILTARELAARLDVSYETVITWTHRGTIPVIRDGRGRMMFSLDAVLKAFRPEAAAAIARAENTRNAAVRAANLAAAAGRQGAPAGRDGAA